MYDILFYKDKNGNEPIKDYLYELKRKSLTSKNNRIMVEKILTYIKILEEYGTLAGLPHIGYLGDNLWELRPLNQRILFFYWKDKTYVLLSYFTKKTQKTPRSEIQKAHRIMKVFLDRN